MEINHSRPGFAEVRSGSRASSSNLTSEARASHPPTAGPGLQAYFFLLPFITSLVFAIVPSDLRESDVLSPALYHVEPFQGEQAVVPNTPQDARTKIQTLIQSQPNNATLYRALADTEVELLDFAQAELHMRQFVENSKDKDAAYYALEDFFHTRIRFEDEFTTMLDHARALTAVKNDPEEKSGPYFHFNRALKQIESYGLSKDPEIIFKAIADSYPRSHKPYLDWLEWRRHNKSNAAAEEILELFRKNFPDDHKTYLLKKAALLEPQKAFELLDKNYEPLWDVDLTRELNNAAVRSEKQGEYLISLKQKLEKDPLNLDAATRLFHSYYFAGNTIEAGSILNDFRLLKEKNVHENKSEWTHDELWIMAQLHHRILNLNEAARFYYAFYDARRSQNSAHARDDALHDLFQILLTAEERPIQLGSGNLDLYKDIATADSSPGVLNGILSLILNSANPVEEFDYEQTKAIGYFNRAQASALLKMVQKDYPNSKHLAGMYRDALRIYQKYGMDDLIIKTGEEFFTAFPSSDKLFEVGVEVADAYARKKEHDREWKTFDFLLPIAAKKNARRFPVRKQIQTKDDDESYDSETTATPESPYSYSSLLNRYISSLTREKNYMGVLKLYRDQIVQYPEEEQLYEDFSNYLAQNNLVDEEAGVYKVAINQFKSRNWYEKLARWYLRRTQMNELEKISHEIITIFSGTEVSQYLAAVSLSNPYRSLYRALNEYALSQFPYNLTFVHNLLNFHSQHDNYNWPAWEKLCRQYYFMDESIRDRYLYRIAKEKISFDSNSKSSDPDKLFHADRLVWRAHFSDSLPFYDELAKKYPSNAWLNNRAADLKRSLGSERVANYKESAQLRSYLAQINPADISLWTAAGDTLAEIEDYAAAKQYWENILKGDPQNAERYLEVATILWDYYLFDDSLQVIEKARDLKGSDSLYAYEAGAIYESKRDYENAISEYSKSLIDDSYEARARLSQLYKRRKLTSLIHSHLEKQLKQNPQDWNWWLGIIQFYIQEQEKETVHQLITKASGTLNSKAFANAVASLKETSRRFGFDSLQESLIQKEIQNASTDLERIHLNLELVRFYESHDLKDKAESVMLALHRKHQASAGTIQEVISYYWRNAQYDKAFGIYNSSLAIANSNYRKQYLREIADRYRERKQYDRALQAIAELRKNDPLNGDLFRFVSEVYAEQGNYKTLSQHYRDGLQMVRDSKLSDEEKKQQIATMRRGIIQANLILKDYTAALDQYIELLNRDTESETLLKEAAFFGDRYELSNRLIEYYQKTAANSPKDHRWPMMLGRLQLYSGNLEAAIAQFQNAIAIRPERTDLHQSLADTYQRAGKYTDALQVYDRIYILTYKDARWLSSMAELNARLGNQKKALQLYEKYLATRTPLERDFEMAQKALSWGMPKSAIAYGNAGLKKFQANLTLWLPSEGFAAYIEALVQTGASSNALEIMHQTLNRFEAASKKATFDQEALRSAEFMVKDSMVRIFPALIKKYLTGDELEQLQSKLLALSTAATPSQKSVRFLPVARASGMSKAEEQLLLEILDQGDRVKSHSYSTYYEQLRRFYLDRLAYADYAKFLEREWRKNRLGDRRLDLVEIAKGYRLSGMHDRELAILREYYQFGKSYSLQPETVERYLTLLYERNHRNELKASTATANLTVANYFVKRKDRELAEMAIATLSKTQDPVWKTIHLAMLGKELSLDEPSVQEFFARGLDLRTIGDSIDTHSDSRTSVLGDDWFYYGTRYGEYLWNTGKSEASYYLVSDVEGAPVRSEYQDQLGLFYLEKAKLTDFALQHFTLALEVTPANVSYQDHRAEALHSLGKKEEAIATWKSIIAEPSASRYLIVCRAAARHGFLDQIQSHLEKYVTVQIGKYGAAGIDELISVYLENVNAERRKTLISEWIRIAPAPKEFGSALLRLSFPNNDDKTLIFQQTGTYLKNKMQSAAGQEIELARNQWASWNSLAISEYFKLRQIDLAKNATTEVMEELKRAKEADEQLINKFTLLNAKVLLRSEQKDQAVELLKKYVSRSLVRSSEEENSLDEEKYRNAAELLKKEGARLEAATILEEMYQRKLSAGSEEPSLFIGLAEIYLEQNRIEEAMEYLNRMIYGAPENLDNFELAAQALEKQNQFVVALTFRKELTSRKPWDQGNRSKMAEDFLAEGKSKEASTIAQSVIESSQSTLEESVRASKVLATSSSKLVGALELQEIQKVIRSKKHATTISMYYSELRQILIEQNPSLEILLAEKYVNPGNQSLEVPLFRSYRKSQLCEQALTALDRDNSSFGEYYIEQEYTRNYDEYDEYQGYDPTENYPINRLHLPKDESILVALEAADCAAEIGAFNRQIFFLNVALKHVETTEKETEIKQKIELVEKAAAEASAEDAARWKVSENLGRQS